MTQYLIDTNCFIEAKNVYYPFDFAPSFWEQLGSAINEGSILIHDAVFDELIKGDDELKEWIKDHAPKLRISITDSESMKAYQLVLNHVHTCGHYNEAGRKSWSESTIADPQLIASAIVLGVTIVTREKPTNKNQTRKKTNPKIPDVASDLKVRSITLFQMMRELGFKL